MCMYIIMYAYVCVSVRVFVCVRACVFVCARAFISMTLAFVFIKVISYILYNYIINTCEYKLQSNNYKHVFYYSTV